MVFNVSYFHGEESFGDPMHFVRKHLTSIAIGIAAAAFASRFGSERMRHLAYPLLGVAVVLWFVLGK